MYLAPTSGCGSGSRACVRGGEDPAEVRVPALVLAEQREMRSVLESVTSAPVIGRTPSAFAAWANSSEP